MVYSISRSKSSRRMWTFFFATVNKSNLITKIISYKKYDYYYFNLFLFSPVMHANEWPWKAIKLFHFPFLSLILDDGTFHASQLIFAEVLIQRIWQRESQTLFIKGKAAREAIITVYVLMYIEIYALMYIEIYIHTRICICVYYILFQLVRCYSNSILACTCPMSLCEWE